jgi:hypothetical protein
MELTLEILFNEMAELDEHANEMSTGDYLARSNELRRMYELLKQREQQQREQEEINNQRREIIPYNIININNNIHNLHYLINDYYIPISERPFF